MNWNSSELICCDAPAQLAEHGIRDVVFAVGTFDGLHRGHVAVIRAMLDESRRLNATPAVLTFRPHPRAVLTPDNPPPLLMSPERKLDILASLGVKAVVSLPFTKEFAALSPEERAGIRRYENWCELLEKERPDLVSVALPSGLHFAAAKDALEPIEEK